MKMEEPAGIKWMKIVVLIGTILVFAFMFVLVAYMLSLDSDSRYYQVCPSCHNNVYQRYKYCNYCGTKLKEEKTIDMSKHVLGNTK